MSNSGADGGLGRGMDDDVNPPTRTTMPAHALPVGTRIRDYQILGLLGEGGFGIVYLAMDVLLERQVAIKEYLPTSIAWRGTGNLQVAVRVARDQDTFALGLRSFVNEARLLARFDHPSLIKVHRFWEENGTAYMVMPFYRGRTLQRTLERLGRRPSEAELRAWLAPLMDALQVMHAEKCYHRDISPDNVLITESGPMLLDFGAARRVIGDVQRALTVVLKPGFAPIEQYGDTPGLKQGAWTDVYALAGMLFAAITSRRPPPAVARLMDDPMPKVGEVAVGQYSAAFLQAIDRGLALMPKDRPQSVAEFRALMDDPDYVAPPA
ncbi:MAG TPA: serine/threonine-protein kinase, partial [Rubrivivax sp.]|nr:serine/threonine-protein kinase [Rubrivivax sp.]